MVSEPLVAGIQIEHRSDGGVKLEGVLGESMSSLAGTSALNSIPLKQGLLQLSTDPTWYLANGKVFRIHNEEVLLFLKDLSVELSAEETERFRQETLPELMRLLPVHSPRLAARTIQEKPLPRLYLSEAGAGLRLELRFAYGDHEVEASDVGEGVVRSVEEAWQYALVLRDIEEEKRLFNRILSLDT
jgi:hypothetical protein